MSTDPTADAVTRTKADPNRSIREDDLVYEVERLRAEYQIIWEVLEDVQANVNLPENLNRKVDDVLWPGAVAPKPAAAEEETENAR